MTDRIRRSFLYTPADTESLMRKAPDHDADAVIYELEDGIAVADKGTARENLSILADLEFDNQEVCVRINSLNTKWWFKDLRAALDAGVDTVVIPKVNYAWQIRAAVETTRQMASDPPEFLFFVERSAGWVNVGEITTTCSDHPEVTGVLPGNEFSAAVGASNLEGRARIHVLTEMTKYAPLGGLDLYNPLSLELEDMGYLRDFASEARELGYRGMVAVAPNQLDVINEVFTPSEAEYEAAKTVVEKFDATDAGGVLIEEAGFVDRPIVNPYRRTINRYNRVNDIDERYEIEDVYGTPDESMS